MERSTQIDTNVHTHESLVVNTFGYSKTEGGHRFGPAVRSYYLIHYVTAGRGSFTANSITYQLEAGQGFLITPNQQTVYSADTAAPWSYIWLGFSGETAEALLSSIGLTAGQPVFHCDCNDQLRETILAMLAHRPGTIADRLSVLSLFYSFFSILAQSNSVPTARSIGKHSDLPVNQSLLHPYINRVNIYIQKHMSEPMTITELATSVGLHRSYLSSLYKEITGLSPLQYLQSVRLTKSKHLLETSTLSVSSIAQACGFERAESYIKLFKRRFGTTPAAYRRFAGAATKGSERCVLNHCTTGPMHKA